MKTLLHGLLALTLSAQAASDRALYIAARQDGQPGTGTITDPFDGSDARKLWSAWMRTAFRRDGVSGQTIVFLPGTYAVTNELRLPYDAKDVTVSGYGARMVFADKALTGQRTILCTSWDGNHDVTWEGFTLDCGSEVKFSGNGKVCGVYSRGRNNVVRDVTIRKLACYNKAPYATGYHEAFGIVLYSDGGICSGNLVTGTAGGESQTLTGISVSGNDCSISGNVVDFGDESATNNVTSFGYSAYGNRLLFSGNVARRVDAGVSMDGAGDLSRTNAWEDNLFVGNQFSGNTMTVRIQNNSQSYRNWLWVGNQFNAQGRQWLSMWTSDVWKANRISGHRFVGNAFGGTPQKKENMRLSNYQEEPHVFIGNSFVVEPSIDTMTNSNTLVGGENVVRGKRNDKAFGGRDLKSE